MKKIEGNILRYYLFSAFSFTPFALPVFVLFWKDNGLDFFQIFVLQGIFSVAMVLFEIPTGMIGDRLGKKTSLIASASIFTIAFIIYGSGRSFTVFLIAELICAIAAALISGADSAFLYDTLKTLGRENEYQQIEGKARAIQLVSFAVCNLIGGFIGNYSYRAVVYMSAIGPFIALITSLGLIETNKAYIADSFINAIKSYKDLMKESLKFVRKHQLIRWIVSFSAIIIASGGWLLWLYQPYMQWTGLPVWAFGIAFAIFNLFAAYMSSIAHKFEDYFGTIKTIYIFMALQIFPLILMSIFISPLSFLFILGHQSTRALSRPILNDWILKYTYADKRATLLSINSLGGRLFFGITSPLLGYISNHTDYPTNFMLQAVSLLFLFILLLIMYRKIPEKYFQKKDSVSSFQ